MDDVATICLMCIGVLVTLVVLVLIGAINIPESSDICPIQCEEIGLEYYKISEEGLCVCEDDYHQITFLTPDWERLEEMCK